MVAGLSDGGRCGAGGAGRGDSGCVRCTGRGGGRGTGGFAKSREVGAGSGSGAGGTENSKIGSVGTCSGCGFASDGGAGGVGSGAVDGSGGESACCWRSSRCGSVEGWGLAAVDSAGGPALSGACRPAFDGVLSNITMIGGSSGSVGCNGAIHQIAPPIR